jgi:hypothetical protein
MCSRAVAPRLQRPVPEVAHDARDEPNILDNRHTRPIFPRLQRRAVLRRVVVVGEKQICEIQVARGHVIIGGAQEADV